MVNNRRERTLSKEQQDRIIADFAALDESRQEQLADEATRLLEQQDQSA